MTESDQLLKNRFSELSRRSFSRGCYVYSEFLTVAEQDILCKMAFEKGSAPFSLTGGYTSAERKIACFGDEKLCGYSEIPPITCLLISPISQKFADDLTHRDFLGSILALGLNRNVLGDIVLKENSAYLFCLESVSGFISENLVKVRHTVVKCSITEAGELTAELPEPTRVNIASERLDALVAAVYRLSRSESQQLIIEGRVYVDSRLTEDVNKLPAAGSIISVRGLGRFIYEGVEYETKKGRLMVSVIIF